LAVVLSIVELLGDDGSASVLLTNEVGVEVLIVLVLEPLLPDVASADVPAKIVDDVPEAVVLVLGVLGLLDIEPDCEVSDSVLATYVLEVDPAEVLLTTDVTSCDVPPSVVDEVV